MLARKDHTKISLGCRLLYTLRTLSRIHILNDLNSMLCDLIIYLLLLCSQLTHQLICVLVCTFPSDLPIKVIKVLLKLVLALYHGLPV